MSCDWNLNIKKYSWRLVFYSKFGQTPISECYWVMKSQKLKFQRKNIDLIK